MILADFEYNGELLSEHGCIPGSINTGYDSDISLGSNLTLNTIKNNDVEMVISTDYAQSIKVTFDIIKTPCGYNNLDEFTEFDVERLMVWLNRKGFYKFKPLYDFTQSQVRRTDYLDTIFFGTFTDIQAARIGGKIVGYTLTLTTNSPYGYSDNDPITKEIIENDNEIHIYNSSQELGYLYPNKVTIKCNSGGIIKLVNETDSEERITEVKNCISGEIITFDCKNKIITSSVEHETLYNDFNYNFPRLIREYIETDNVISLDTSSMSSATVTYEYYPIRKVGVFV